MKAGNGTGLIIELNNGNKLYSSVVCEECIFRVILVVDISIERVYSVSKKAISCVRQGMDSA